jgi:hypothetical protein
MNMTICTCGVLTGGARDPKPTCPVHLSFARVLVRVDSILCDSGEIWLENPDGAVRLVWSENQKSPTR